MNSGIHVALITPFDDKEEVDYKSLKNTIINLENEGICNGLVLFGSTGEGNSMSDEEKLDILKFLKDFDIEDSFQITIGLGGINTKNIIEFGRKTLEYIDNPIFMLSPPPYVKAKQQTIEKHYCNIMDKFDNKFILYNIPSRTSTKVEPETIKKLYIKYGSKLTGIKDATGNLIDFIKVKALIPELDIFCGDDILSPAMMAMGAKGLISVYGNYSCEILLKTLDGKKYNWNELKKLSWCGEENPRRIKYLLFKKNIINHPITKSPLYSDYTSLNDQEFIDLFLS